MLPRLDDRGSFHLIMAVPVTSHGRVSGRIGRRPILMAFNGVDDLDRPASDPMACQWTDVQKCWRFCFGYRFSTAATTALRQLCLVASRRRCRPHSSVTLAANRPGVVDGFAAICGLTPTLMAYSRPRKRGLPLQRPRSCLSCTCSMPRFRRRRGWDGIIRRAFRRI
jgi:hypothetical protein